MARGRWITRGAGMAALVAVVVTGWPGVRSAVLARTPAFTTVSHPFSGATNLVTGVPSCPNPSGTLGPIGALTDARYLYVDDFCNNTMYRFGLNGGTAPQAQLAVANGLDSGLTLSHGVYFGIAQASSNIPAGLYAFNPSTLARSPLLVPASQFGGTNPKDVVADPRSRDLYVSANPGIYRVRGATSGHPIVTLFASVNVDGIAFTRDGATLYGAGAGANVGFVYGFDRTGRQVFDVNLGAATRPDGIAVAPHYTVNGVNVAGNVFVNTNIGTVLRIDVNHGNAVSTVASGGTRGDFVIIDTEGYLDVSQSDRYVRLLPNFFGPKPASTVRPVIVGTPAVGQTLTCRRGTWSGFPTSYAYRWNRNGAAIGGAHQARYTVVAADRGQALTCTVTARNGGAAASATSNAVTVAS